MPQARWSAAVHNLETEVQCEMMGAVGNDRAAAKLRATATAAGVGMRRYLQVRTRRGVRGLIPILGKSVLKISTVTKCLPAFIADRARRHHYWTLLLPGPRGWRQVQ